MGSPLSPIEANLYMETFEREALASAVTAPRLWLRYEVETFVIWTHVGDKLEEFQHHLSQRHPQMKFTKEMEKDNRISFFYILVEIKSGTFTTAVYRKPTHTDLYKHYSSHRHPQVKSGTVSCQRRRAEMICDDTNRNE